MSTFLQVVELLLTNDDAKAAYTNNPTGFLDSHGFGSFDPDDVTEAMGHSADALPASVARHLDADHGLGSAATLDLDEHGLSLDREPIDVDIFDEPVADDVDLYGADGDVDFDAPSESDTFGPSDGSTLDTPDTPDIAELDDAPVSPITDQIDTRTEPDDDPGDYLTDVPFDVAPYESPNDVGDFEGEGVGLVDDLLGELGNDADPDTSDDFDLD